MEQLGLKFDEMKIDAQLALDYFKKNNHEYFSLNCDKKKTKYVLDNAGNKIYYAEIFDENELYFDNIKCPSDSQFEDLAKEIKANAELFSQIEAVVRKRARDEVHNCDIKLMTQNLSLRAFDRFFYSYIIMDENTPLLMLSCVAQMLYKETSALIVATPNTAAACHLFTQLCHKVGLNNVQLIITEFNSAKSFLSPKRVAHSINMDDIEALKSGCAGVITEHSDIDSAVDVFLSSTIAYPWKVRRILVQESVYEDVKNAFEWKCNLKNGSVETDISSLCVKAFSFQNKMFAFDYVGAYNEQLVLVEAYRTNKELITLLLKYKPYFLSLWANDISEANEIAFSTNAYIVWTNDFGTFDGPSEASRAFFHIFSRRTYETVKKCNEVDKLLNLRDIWLKIELRERNKVVNDVVKDYVSKLNDPKIRSEFDERYFSKSSYLVPRPNQFVEVKDGRICIGIHKTVDLMLYNDLNKVLEYLIFGTGILIFRGHIHDQLFEMLAEKKAPVVLLKTVAAGDFKISKHPVVETKIVYQNYGTIFAN